MFKYGHQNGKQRYKCHLCNRIFTGGNRIDLATLWKEYLSGKQTYTQLAKKYNCSSKTIQRKLDSYAVEVDEKEPLKIVILMDTTYFGRGFGVMLFKDAYTKENLLKYYVKSETNGTLPERNK